jgi:hypothetical protein
MDIKQIISLLILTALLIILPVPVVAQTPDADVDFYAVEPLEGDMYAVGDLITLRLEVKHAADSRVTLPNVEDEWGSFEVVRQTGQDTVRNNDGTATTRKDIVIQLFEPGQYETPRLVVSHRKSDSTTEELSTPIIPLQITSVLVEGDEELRALKPQADLPVPPLWPWILGGLALATVAAGGLFWAGRWAYNRLWPKPAVVVEPVVMVDPRPPEEIAFAELDRIENLNLPANARLKEHYSLVTDCLRRYIEDRYNIFALEQTTREIQTSFRYTGIVPPPQAEDLIELFTSSDLVKFARVTPPPTEAYIIVDEARRLVRETIPSTEPLEPLPELAVSTLLPPAADGSDFPPETLK